MPPRPKRRTQRREQDPVSQVKWESPPERATQYDWPAIAKQLRRKPGAWAKVFDRDRVSIANAIRQNKVAAVRPRDGFEVTTSNNNSTATGPERTCTMFLRFNPDGKAD